MRLFLHKLFLFRPYKPRNPVLRVLIGLIGLVVLVALVIFGMFAGLTMLLYTAVRRLFNPSPAPTVRTLDPNTIEGEYSVVNKQQPSLRLH